MPWINLQPLRAGGTGRPRGAATAIVYQGGDLTITHNSKALLGTPDRVRISYDPDAERIRLMPTTPGDVGGFALSGGGNSPYRASVRQMVKDHPNMVGHYNTVKTARGIELQKDEGGDGELEL